MIIVIVICFILYNENTWLKNTSYIINLQIPKEFDSFKIAQISDIHNTQSKRLKNSIIKSLKSAKPDIIVITGDLIDSNRTDIDCAVDFIKEIKDIAPIYYVTGNHEGAVRDYNKLKESLIENNVFVLESNCEEIERNGAKINIVGINDPNFLHGKNNAEKTTKAIKKINYDKNNFTVLLSHRPELIDVYSDLNINLVICGHAHGGQIILPFIGPLFAPGQGYLPKYTSGIYNKNKTTMIVSRGIGNSTFPFRINNRPELVIITLAQKT